MRRLFKFVAYLLFFGWNLWFLAWIALGLGPTILFQLVVAVASGMIPLSYGLFTGLLLVTPLLGLLTALIPTLRRDPGRLLAVFYGVQFPVMLLCTLRLFAIQQVTWPVGLSLALGALGALTLLRTLVSGPEERPLALQLARQVGQAGYALVGLWWALLVSIYALTAALLLLSAFWDAVWSILSTDRHWYGPWYGLEFALFATFAGLTAAVLLVFPFAMVGVSLRALQLVSRATASRIGAAATWALSGVTLAGWLLAILLTGRQHQGAAFAWLDAATTDEGRRAAVAHTEVIHAGLLDARLAVERTLDSDPTGEHVRRMWKDLVGETLAVGPQWLWRGLLWPYVYHPVTDEVSTFGRGWVSVPADARDASVAYAAFFDAPMDVAERDTLVAAMRNSWSWEDARASLLEVGQQRVHLDRQQIDVVPRGDVAEVTVHDVYRNRTWDRQEVLVHFSLPESAAITGLWMGPEDDRAKAFAYTVAPRGAAQEVYQNEVRQRRDPALLEQVGPREYRLRAFPVEPREGRVDDVFSITAEGPEMHLWLTVTVPLATTADGATVYALPRTTEVRNLFWDRATTRTLDGASFRGDGWTPDAVPAPTAARQVHDVAFDGWRVRAEPAGAAAAGRFGRLVVLVDGTRSMERHRTEVAHALTALRGASDALVVLCTVEQRLQQCPDYDAATALAWGATPLETRLVEAAPHAAGADGLVVLTDEGSYSLAAEAERAGLPDVVLPTLWLVHFGAEPTAYPDWTLDQLQRTGGGVAGGIGELLARRGDPAILDGWRWTFAADPSARAAPDAIAPIAARRLVAHLDQQRRSGALATLDELHAVAVRNHVVTSYSSMLVLVDEAQRQRLAEAERRADRFDREVIDAEPAALTSAPEPGALLLVALGAVGALAGRSLRKR